jgi:hypothetical protein
MNVKTSSGGMKVKTSVRAGLVTAVGGNSGSQPQCLLPIGCHPPIIPIGGL